MKKLILVSDGIRYRHILNIWNFAKEHNGAVYKFVFREEATKLLDEVDPDWRKNDYPNDVWRGNYDRFYLATQRFAKKHGGRFQSVKKKHLGEKFGQAVLDELEKHPGEEMFVFTSLTDNPYFKQGCADCNHFDNENPNRRNARRLSKEVDKMIEKRASLPADEQADTFNRHMKELTSDGTDGAE